MKTLQISTSDLEGGAPRAAFRLHGGLRDQSIQSRMWVQRKKSKDSDVVVWQPGPGALLKIRRYLRRKSIERSLAQYPGYHPEKWECFNEARTRLLEDSIQQMPECDVVNLHWIAGFLDFHCFFQGIAGKQPVVWTLHDMNAFTGGCHYDNSCGRFMASCGACPQLGSTDPQDLSHKSWARKQKALASFPVNGLHLVSPSQWLADIAKKSPLFQRFEVSAIPNGIDLQAFAPRDKNFAKTCLGLPADSRAVLFVADSLNNERKGLRRLLEALGALRDIPNLRLMTVGRNKPTGLPEGIPVHSFESINLERIMSLIYSAADAFVIPSVQDNLPNVISESLACGTPVVGFKIGGIPEMIEHRQNGLLVEDGNVQALAESIRFLLTDTTARTAMPLRSRQIAEERYSQELQARRYLALYERMLSQKGKR